MKKLLYLTTLILALALAACGGSEPTPTPAPTDPLPTVVIESIEAPATPEPAVLPTREDSSLSGTPLDTMEHTPDPELVNKTWAWESRDPNGGATDAILCRIQKTTPWFSMKMAHLMLR
ncbi:MAG: hypothetical protein M5U34_26640 [Chloroflexi bacterium]|nr:hypothetical protein [Chloroflexota bacterium]